MPAEGQEVAPHRLHIDRAMAGRLRRVDQRGHAERPGARAQFRGGIDRAHGVGDMGKRENFHLRGEQLIQPREVQQAVVALDGQESEHGAGALGQHLPWHEVRVVFELGQEDFVPRPDVAAAPGRGHEIDGFRGAARENDFIRAACVDELRGADAGAFIGRCRAIAQLMNPAVDVAMVVLVIMADRIDDRPRFLAAGCAIQVNQRPAVNILVENGKIRPQSRPIDGQASVWRMDGQRSMHGRWSCS